MSYVPCKRVVCWLGQCKKSDVSRDDLRHEFAFSEEDLDDVLNNLIKRGLIHQCGRIGNKIVQFAIHSKVKELQSEVRNCSGYGQAQLRQKKVRTIFLVHGRDDVAHDGLLSTLREEGLAVFTWKDALAQMVKTRKVTAPHTMAVLNYGMESADAVIVLFTGDEEARLKDRYRKSNDPRDETELLFQPRPNVIFEAGMAWALYPDRTVFVGVGRLRAFSDISGLYVVQIPDVNDWGELVKYLQRVGWIKSPKLTIPASQKSLVRMNRRT